LATTNAPCIMVGEKCADIIAKEKPMGLTTWFDQNNLDRACRLSKFQKST
jgi:hypothetical protein